MEQDLRPLGDQKTIGGDIISQVSWDFLWNSTFSPPKNKNGGVDLGGPRKKIGTSEASLPVARVTVQLDT